MKAKVGTRVAVAVVLVLASNIPADVLCTVDGRKLEGKLLEQNASKVVFEVHAGRVTTVMSFPATQVVSITAGPLKTGEAAGPQQKAPSSELDIAGPEPDPPPIVRYTHPTYYVVPLHGEVGKTVLANLLARSLEDAVRRQPHVVILDVNSPGGMIMEAHEIVGVIRQYNHRLRIVTLAGDALSAAAIISISTKEIYVRPSGIIGAAVAYTDTTFGMPATLAEKFQSVWRAAARSSAETGGHDPILVEAMIDEKLELHLVAKDGKKQIKEGTGEKMLTRKGRLLTLTAGEAVECGLAAGKAGNYEQLGALLGFKQWTECKGLATPLAEHWAKVVEEFDKHMKKLAEDFTDNMERAEQAMEDRAKCHYTYYVETHRLTPLSQKKWRENTLTCVQYLRRAQKNVEQAVALAEKFEQMEPLSDMLKARLKEVRQLADRIYKSKDNYDVGNR